jgi:RNA recognition motif-containing protein
LVLQDLHDPSRNRGFLFVEYYNHACADYAKQKLSAPNFKVDGSQLTVSWAEPKGSSSSDSSSAAAQVYTVNEKSALSMLNGCTAALQIELGSLGKKNCLYCYFIGVTHL